MLSVGFLLDVSVTSEYGKPLDASTEQRVSVEPDEKKTDALVANLPKHAKVAACRHPATLHDISGWCCGEAAVCHAV